MSALRLLFLQVVEKVTMFDLDNERILTTNL